MNDPRSDNLASLLISQVYNKHVGELVRKINLVRELRDSKTMVVRLFVTLFLASLIFLLTAPQISRFNVANIHLIGAILMFLFLALGVLSAVLYSKEIKESLADLELFKDRGFIKLLHESLIDDVLLNKEGAGAAPISQLLKDISENNFVFNQDTDDETLLRESISNLVTTKWSLYLKY